MKAMMHVAWLSLLKTRKEKWVLLIMMGLALLFASVFGTVFGAGGGRGLPKIYNRTGSGGCVVPRREIPVRGRLRS